MTVVTLACYGLQPAVPTDNGWICQIFNLRGSICSCEVRMKLPFFAPHQPISRSLFRPVVSIATRAGRHVKGISGTPACADRQAFPSRPSGRMPTEEDRRPCCPGVHLPADPDLYDLPRIAQTCDVAGVATQYAFGMLRSRFAGHANGISGTSGRGPVAPRTTRRTRPPFPVEGWRQLRAGIPGLAARPRACPGWRERRAGTKNPL